jgi:capsular polysaccharide biosynthesis protein
MTERPVNSKDEIELIEILHVVWKWKYLILVGTLGCALIAGVVSWNSPRVYRISMVFQPAVVRIDEWGRKIQMDSADNMKALIEAGALKEEIIDHLKSLKVKNRPGSLRFRVTSPRRSDIIKISYETPNIETGKEILNQIPNFLLKEYKDSVRMIENYFEEKIKAVSEDLYDYEKEKAIAMNDVNILQKQINELDSEIDNLQDNNKILIKKRNNLVPDKDSTHLNLNLLYTNAIQENLRTINEYKNQLLNLLSQKKKTEIQLKRIEEKIDVIIKALAALKKEKSSLQYIQVLQNPTSTGRPIKPKPKVAVLVTAVMGLFMMVIASFIIEYISRYRSKKHL